jgi:2-polyprenyl-3-methyl-5-hydroxy-6-metoxy-1,4-benzoquinol methylase
MGFLEGAELTLSLIDELGVKGQELLEIGGGIGLVYGYLKSNGFSIHSIEPSASGFEGYYETALELFNTLKIDKSHWYPLLAQDSHKIGKNFDIIFSNNVLEHIKDLKSTFNVLKGVLKPRGLMVHNTVNYIIPYEPHFKIVLVPLIPRLTEVFRPGIRHSKVWKGLNFITTRQIKLVCESCDLDVVFDKGVLLRTLRRLEEDHEFAIRQGRFIPIYKFLQKTCLLRTLNYLPVSLTTPITFKVKNKDRESI